MKKQILLVGMEKIMNLPIGFPVIMLALTATLRAEVKPHALFSDGAVLQRGIEVPVWGTAGDGEKVTVRFAGQTVTTTASKGEWKVRLQKMRASTTAQTMTLAGLNTVEIKNLQVGDVWVCGGQSNMQFPMAKFTGWQTGVENAQEVIAKANDPMIRLFTVPRQGNPQPQRDVGGNWSECSSQSVAGFSAVAYFFGRDLRQAKKVPVGLISANVGATAAAPWTSRRAVEAHPELQSIVGASSALYNAMIAPLQPFAIAGVIWYQGESDTAAAQIYQTLFPALIKGWRDEWGQGEFPFLFAQITPHNEMKPEIREAQLLTWQKTPKTAMVVTTDVGSATDIHPRNKEPVGARLALAARAVAYGEKIEYSGPVYQSMKVVGQRAVLTFTHLGGGLVAQAGELKGFTIAGDDKKFVPAMAKIEGGTVVVAAKEVAKPVAVRYGWSNVPDVNLFNKAGLPATPFRTDR
jgi:sialate O-acetylesterase